MTGFQDVYVRSRQACEVCLVGTELRAMQEWLLPAGTPVGPGYELSEPACVWVCGSCQQELGLIESREVLSIAA
jgi:hypothetical protein